MVNEPTSEEVITERDENGVPRRSRRIWYTRDRRVAVEYGYKRFCYDWTAPNGTKGTTYIYLSTMEELQLLLNRWFGDGWEYKNPRFVLNET